MKKQLNKYKCKYCGEILIRLSDKKWIKSYCETKGKDVHIIYQGKFNGYKRTKTSTD
jgi:hypothetical protein